MLIQEPVQAAIWHCLDHYDYFDAIFLAERLNAEVESDESTFLLATCYYRAGKPNQAYSLLRRKGCITPQCKFLLAKCCLEFENLSEAETILRGSSSSDEEVYSEQLNIDSIVTEYGEHAVFVLRLLSEICYQTERDKIANELNRKILKLNPFVWSSFEMLCNRSDLPPIIAPSTNHHSQPVSGSKPVHNNTTSSTPLTTQNSNVGPPPSSNGAAPAAPAGDKTIPPSLDPAKLFNIGNLDNFNYCHGSNSVLNYYNVGLGQQQQQPPLNQSMDQSDGGGMPLINCTPVQHLNSINANNHSSGGVGKQQLPQFTPDDSSQFKPVPPRVGKQYRTRSGLNTIMSPLNASFGILPLDSSNSFGADTPPNTGPPPPLISNPPAPLLYTPSSPLIINSSGNHLPLHPPPSHQTLSDANEQKPIVKRQIMSKRATTTPLHGNSQSPGGNTPPSPLPLQGTQNTVRRSSRLFTISNNNYSVKENNKSPNRNNKFATPKSPSKKSKSKQIKAASDRVKSVVVGGVVNYGDERNERNIVNNGGAGDGSERELLGGVNLVQGGGGVMGVSREHVLSVQKHVAGGLLDLLKELGRAYYYFSQYECDRCICVLNSLPAHHLNTGFSLTLMAKAYYESSRYKEAIKCFAKVRELEPKRTQGMELYSTALWQQQQEVELSALAQDMNRVDQFCPQTWCVNGNCFSAQKEHDTAIKYFQRATQVDPNFAYAYTLLGHEYVLTEELDKAMNCYRHAVRIDPRHYNAWYGIGSIYSKQERFLLAEIHFRKALKINPNSSVLMCHIGVAQNALGKIDAALYTFNLALEKDPKNPLCKFHRASILFGTGRHQEALQELDQLKDIVPKESLVYYLAGKVHKKLGNTHLALMHFSWATDLDPKGANSQIKEAIDPAMNRSATTSDLHLEEDIQDDLDSSGGPAGGSGDAGDSSLFASSSPPPPSSSSSRAGGTSSRGGVTPSSGGGHQNQTPVGNNNNNNNNNSSSSLSGLNSSSAAAAGAAPLNNNNSGVSANSGLSSSRDGGYHRRDETDELDEELDDEDDDEDNISGLELLGSSATHASHDNTSDMYIGDSDDTETLQLIRFFCSRV
uniref:Cell division cycle protein 27 homolog n=1 Tax=Cacopsylla melanoneura TaxID=428564 RepID=A0A8D9BRU1_9HEMI